MDFLRTLTIAASGLRAQAGRMRIISENIANADSTPQGPGADPYRRKTITFEDRLDRRLGADVVRVKQIGRDAAEFPQRYDPENPAANAEGYVRTPNVKTLVEVMDMQGNRVKRGSYRAISSARKSSSHPAVLRLSRNEALPGAFRIRL